MGGRKQETKDYERYRDSSVKLEHEQYIRSLLVQFFNIDAVIAVKEADIYKIVLNMFYVEAMRSEVL